MCEYTGLALSYCNYGSYVSFFHGAELGAEATLLHKSRLIYRVLAVVAVMGEYAAALQHDPNSFPGVPPNDLRPSQVFHAYPSYPGQNMNGASMAPPLHDGMDAIGAHGPSTHTTVASAAAKTETEERNTALYGDLPESKRRRFILVEDTARSTRVRVRVTLDQVEMNEMPDSYRKANSVFPRSYFPTQMQSPPSSTRGNRFFDNDDPDGGVLDDGKATSSRTLVPVPMLEGVEGEIAVPKLTRAKKRKEVTLNDLGYRISWSQSRVFAGRIMFLQKSREYCPNSTIQHGSS